MKPGYQLGVEKNTYYLQERTYALTSSTCFINPTSTPCTLPSRPITHLVTLPVLPEGILGVHNRAMTVVSTKSHSNTTGNLLWCDCDANTFFILNIRLQYENIRFQKSLGTDYLILGGCYGFCEKKDCSPYNVK